LQSPDRREQARRNNITGARLQDSKRETQRDTSFESVQADHPRTRLEPQGRLKIYELLGIMALVIAGILSIVGSFQAWWVSISPTTYENSSMWLWIGKPTFILVLGGLVVLHVRQATSYGRLGLAAFLVTSLGLILITVNSFIGKSSLALYYALQLPWDVGLVLFGTVISRAGVLPRWSGWLLVGVGIIGAVADLMYAFADDALITDTSLRLYFASQGIYQVLAGLSVGLLGYALWTRRGHDTGRQPES
jgi:hypothetical protein